MVNAVSGAGAPGLATALMQAKTDRENLAVAVVKKGQDIEKSTGEAALKLIDSSSPSKIDIHV